jgi:hypothetical protein
MDPEQNQQNEGQVLVVDDLHEDKHRHRYRRIPKVGPLSLHLQEWKSQESYKRENDARARRNPPVQFLSNKDSARVRTVPFGATRIR